MAAAILIHRFSGHDVQVVDFNFTKRARRLAGTRQTISLMGRMGSASPCHGVTFQHRNLPAMAWGGIGEASLMRGSSRRLSPLGAQ